MDNYLPAEIIENKIYLIRGQKVMLDKDLAKLYGVETRTLNQAVRRNSERFPDDFMFSLTRKEILRISQIVTSLKFSKNINVFTENGVAMLSSVINSKRAIFINIQIMRTFTKLRKIMSSNQQLAKKLQALENRVDKHDDKIQSIFEAIRQMLIPPTKPKRIGFMVDAL